MAVIVGVTAVLVTEPPAKASVKPPKYFTTTAPVGNLGSISRPSPRGQAQI